MTSSLVGSEMCIRDRGKAKEGKKAKEKSNTKKRTARNEARKDTTQKAQPVSYTHLTLPTICSV
eukprot:7628196-Prorocentrum_lima.AAC.1